MSRDTADIVIVGAGIMGLALAYQISRRSTSSVVVVEKGHGPAEGSTGASSSIIRQRYTHPEVIRIAHGGLLAFRNWSEFTRLAAPSASFRNVGVLWMLGESREAVAADRDRLAAEGVDAMVLTAADVQERFPALSTCGSPFDLTGAVEHECGRHDSYLFEADGGFSQPVLTAQDLLEAARREGADVRFRSPVTGIDVSGGRVDAVRLAGGDVIEAGIVVNAAGPWCNRLNALAGLELKWDLVPTRVGVIYRELPPEVPRPLPVVADSSTGIYFRPEAGDQQILCGSVLEEDEQEEVDPDEFNPNVDRSFSDVKIHGLHHRLPDLPYRGQVGGLSGLYMVNRDDVHPIIGPTEIEGYHLINGFSGHGFKESLMCTSMLAQHLTGERADFDTDVPLEFFAVDREPIAVADKNVLA